MSQSHLVLSPGAWFLHNLYRLLPSLHPPDPFLRSPVFLWIGFHSEVVGLDSLLEFLCQETLNSSLIRDCRCMLPCFFMLRWAPSKSVGPLSGSCRLPITVLVPRGPSDRWSVTSKCPAALLQKNACILLCIDLDYPHLLNHKQTHPLLESVTSYAMSLLPSPCRSCISVLPAAISSYLPSQQLFLIYTWRPTPDTLYGPKSTSAPICFNQNAPA